MTNESNCPICGSQSSKLRRIIGPGYRVRRCSTCRFAWIDRPSIDKVSIKPDYNNYDYNNRLSAQYSRMADIYLRGFEKRLTKSLLRTGSSKPTSELNFLDVGCANGEYLRTARSAGISSVYGVEIDKEAILKASKYGHVVTSHIELQDKKFDVIQIKNVLSNIDGFDSFLKSYIGLLENPGVLWIDLLNQDSLLAIIRNIVKPNFEKSGRFGPLRPPYVINGFTKKSASELAIKHSLSTLSIETSYLGSDLVPYSPPGSIAQLIRVGSSYIGLGSMLVCNFAKR